MTMQVTPDTQVVKPDSLDVLLQEIIDQYSAQSVQEIAARESAGHAGDRHKGHNESTNKLEILQFQREAIEICRAIKSEQDSPLLSGKNLKWIQGERQKLDVLRDKLSAARNNQNQSAQDQQQSETVLGEMAKAYRQLEKLEHHITQEADIEGLDGRSKDPVGRADKLLKRFGFNEDYETLSQEGIDLVVANLAVTDSVNLVDQYASFTELLVDIDRGTIIHSRVIYALKILARALIRRNINPLLVGQASLDTLEQSPNVIGQFADAMLKNGVQRGKSMEVMTLKDLVALAQITVEDGTKGQIADLKKIGTLMYRLAKYLRAQREFQDLTSREQANIANLNNVGESIAMLCGIPESEIMTEGMQSFTEEQEYELLRFMVDPHGMYRQRVDGDEEKYKEYIRKLGKITIGSFMGKLARGLNAGGRGSAAIYRGIQNPKALIQEQILFAIQKESNKDVKNSLAEILTTLKDKFGPDAAPDVENLIIIAKARILQHESRIQSQLTFEEKMRLLVGIVSTYDIPRGENNSASYKLSSALNQETDELVCAVRGIILENLIGATCGNEYSVLAKSDPLEIIEGKVVGHVRLIVSDGKNTFYLDGMQNEEKMVQRIEDDDPLSSLVRAYHIKGEQKDARAVQATLGELSAYNIGIPNETLRDDMLINIAAFTRNNADAIAIYAAIKSKNGPVRTLALLGTIASLDPITQRNLRAAYMEELRITDLQIYKELMESGKLDTIIENRQNLTVEKGEGVEQELYDKEPASGSSLEEYEDYIEQLLSYINAQQKKGNQSKEWSPPIGSIVAKARQIADNIVVLTDGQASKADQEYLGLYVDLSVHVGDLEFFLSTSNFDEAKRVAELVKVKELLKAYKNIPFLEEAYRARQAFARALKGNTGAILTKHTDLINKQVERQIRALGAEEYKSGQSSRVGKLTDLMWYVEMNRMRMMAEGDVMLGKEEWKKQTGGTAAQIYGPHLGIKFDLLSPTQLVCLKALGPEWYAAINRGIMDFHSGLNTRYQMLRAHKQTLYGAKYALHSYRRNGYESEKHYKDVLAEALGFRLQLEEASAKTANRIPLDANDDLANRINRFLERRGYNPKDSSERVGKVLDDYIEYLQIGLTRYNPDTDRFDNIYRDQVLAEQLAFCEAHILFSHYSNDDPFYRILVQTAISAGRSSTETKAALREYGEGINVDMHGLIDWVASQYANISFQSGMTARKLTQAYEAIQDVLNSSFSPDIASAINDYDAYKTAEEDLKSYMIREESGLRMAKENYKRYQNDPAYKSLLEEVQIRKTRLSKKIITKTYQDLYNKWQNAEDDFNQGGKTPALDVAREEARQNAENYIHAEKTALETARRNAENSSELIALNAAQSAYDDSINSEGYLRLAARMEAARKKFNDMAINNPAYKAYKLLIDAKAQAVGCMEALDIQIAKWNATGNSSQINIFVAVKTNLQNVINGIEAGIINPVALDSSGRNVIAQAAILARKSVLDKPTYYQALTWENWKDYNKALGKALDLGAPGSDKDKFAHRRYNAIENMYKNMAKFIAGSRWEEIDSLVRDKPLTGLNGFKFRQRGINPFRYNGEQWVLWLDNKSVIGKKVNLTGSEGYVYSYTDMIFRCLAEDDEAINELGTKSYKPQLEDIVAGSENLQNVQELMKNPRDDKLVIKVVNGVEKFDTVGTAYERYVRLGGMIIDVRGLHPAIRNLAPPISGFLRMFFPDLRSPLQQATGSMTDVGLSGQALRELVDNLLVPGGFIGPKFKKRLRRRKGISPFLTYLSIIQEFLVMLGLEFPLHADMITGQEALKIT